MIRKNPGNLLNPFTTEAEHNLSIIQI